MVRKDSDAFKICIQIFINLGLQICEIFEICAADKKQASKYCHVGYVRANLINSDNPSLLVTTELRLCHDFDGIKCIMVVRDIK